ncbi:unnamed protein product [Miscanthus lutarioriparius]|uniref:Uncharacterized protein n=1 Tax=Miscanthus lutarioriparius TaxID=422564 RepID=A0A811NSW2_9POAL|nr:unnamed protein product [Miscanthus lutarioriparius]
MVQACRLSDASLLPILEEDPRLNRKTPPNRSLSTSSCNPWADSAPTLTTSMEKSELDTRLMTPPYTASLTSTSIPARPQRYATRSRTLRSRTARVAARLRGEKTCEATKPRRVRQSGSELGTRSWTGCRSQGRVCRPGRRAPVVSREGLPGGVPGGDDHGRDEAQVEAHDGGAVRVGQARERVLVEVALTQVQEVADERERPGPRRAPQSGARAPAAVLVGHQVVEEERDGGERRP